MLNLFALGVFLLSLYATVLASKRFRAHWFLVALAAALIALAAVLMVGAIGLLYGAWAFFNPFVLGFVFLAVLIGAVFGSVLFPDRLIARAVAAALVATSLYMMLFSLFFADRSGASSYWADFFVLTVLATSMVAIVRGVRRYPRIMLASGFGLVAVIAAIAVDRSRTAEPPPSNAHMRNHVRVAGASALLPYANIVAGEFSKTVSRVGTPIVESGGNRGGLRAFCAGLGPDTTDVANATRKITDAELQACRDAGVTDIVEIGFGYDAVVFVTGGDGPPWALTAKDAYLALAGRIPVDGALVENPNKTWRDVNRALPAWDIVAFIPGERHGLREVFDEKVLAAGCRETGGADLWIKLGKSERAVRRACSSVRTDGGVVNIEGDFNETLEHLRSNTSGVGVVGLRFFEQNAGALKAATVEGVSPSVETISTGAYPASRPLYFYVKKNHLGQVVGLQEYVEFFTSEKMIGPKGPLAEYGLVPLPVDEFDALRRRVREMRTMDGRTVGGGGASPAAAVAMSEP